MTETARPAGYAELDKLSVDPIELSPPKWWRWWKDGRWSAWHLLVGCGLPKAGSWTACNQTRVPDELDALDDHPTPPQPCRRCHAAAAS